MSLFKRLFAKPDQPGWADFLSQSDYRQFEKDLTLALDRNTQPYILDMQDCSWRPAGEEGRLFGLVNMAQTWRQIEPRERMEYLEGFIETIQTVRDQVDDDASFEAIKDQLRVRLFPLDTANHLNGPPDVLVSEAFLTLIAIDYPDTVRSVSPEQIQKWGFEGRLEELYKLALDQTWKWEPVSVSGHELPSGISIRVVSGDSFFSASHALLMDRYLVPANPNGALVVIPHRHTFAFYSIEDRKGLEAGIQALFPMGRGMFEEGPGSITPELLWWRDGKFSVFPYADGVIDIPEELLELVGE